MELLAFFRRVLAWRWTPCVAPVTGSIVIALLTLAVVPDEIGGASSSTGPLALRAKQSESSDSSVEDSKLDGTDTPDVASPTRHPGAGNRRPRMPADAVQGIFHKPQDLPIEPVDPAPQAPPPEPPPPAPTNTVFTLPTAAPVISPPPPPGEPGTLPPPDVPLQPLGPGSPPGAP
jgi:hypothetical protein